MNCKKNLSIINKKNKSSISYMQGEERKDRWRLTTTLLSTSSTTKKAYWVGLNSTAKGCKTTSKKVKWFARAIPYKNKQNKTQWNEYPFIFNQSIIFN
jgi:hypothetical protein